MNTKDIIKTNEEILRKYKVESSMKAKFPWMLLCFVLFSFAVVFYISVKK